MEDKKIKEEKKSTPKVDKKKLFKKNLLSAINKMDNPAKVRFLIDELKRK